MPKKDSTAKGEIPQATIKQLEATIKSEVGDFKAAFKNEFIKLVDEVDEIKEQIREDKRGESKLLLTQKLYRTDRREILEVSRIPPGAVEPLAYALALDAKTSRRGRNGVSLTAEVIDNILRLDLSARGWNRGMSMQPLTEQVSVTQMEGEERMPTVEAGGSR
jgi:hypothetical protein